jgi:hypothetical protein
MRNFHKIKNKEIFFVSSEPAKSLNSESGLQTALWQMYSTARAESISAQEMMESVINWGMTASAALIAGMGFLTQNSSSMQISSSRIQFIGWFFISFVALIEASEYMTQTGKMLRAGYFARQIEKKIIKMLGIFPADMAWETFLSRKDRRLFPGYYFTGGGTILLLAGAQFAPFLFYPAEKRLSIFSQPWWELPVVGTISIFLMCLVQFSIYQRRFPTKDITL